MWNVNEDTQAETNWGFLLQRSIIFNFIYDFVYIQYYVIKFLNKKCDQHIQRNKGKEFWMFNGGRVILAEALK